MADERVYNFAAGPSTMPESALKTAAAEMLNFRGSGMSVMESTGQFLRGAKQTQG